MCFFYNFIRFFETYVLFLHVERDGMAAFGAEVDYINNVRARETINFLIINKQKNERDYEKKINIVFGKYAALHGRSTCTDTG